MVLDRISTMLDLCNTESRLFPATDLYNEGWLLRLILQWFSTHNIQDHPLAFSESARWFSEALLPTAFRPRSREDELGEAWTHADGVIGHFTIGKTRKVDLALKKHAQQFVVIEAKMFSKLSSGVTHARYYDQAARTVACMAEVLEKKRTPASEISHLGFYVLAPSEQFKKLPTFQKYTSMVSIREKVERRVRAYENTEAKMKKMDWFDNRFLPMLEHIEVKCLAWEDLIDYIDAEDLHSGKLILDFYQKCIQYNRTES